MKYKRLPPMELQNFKNFGNRISTNKPPDEIEDAVWNSLCTRATKKTGNRFYSILKGILYEC